MQSPEIRQHVRHNFKVNIADASFFGLAALGFASTVTIIPLFLNSLGASEILIGLVGSIHTIGWQIPQLFTAGIVARLQRFKPMVMMMTVHERWPFFGLAVVALLVPVLHPNLIIGLAFLMLAIYGLGGGLAATAWQSMIGKIMPEEQRGTFFGTQSAFANLLGAGGAVVAGLILERLPSPIDFVICFFLAGVAMMISLWFLGRTREPAHELPPTTEKRPRLAWKQMAAIVRRDSNFRWFLVVRMLTSIALVSVSFYSIYAVRTFRVSETTIGILTSVMTMGQTIANPIFGWLGDRWGHRSMYLIGGLMIAVSVSIMIFATEVTWFYVAFALAGAANATFWSVAIALTLEFGEEHEKPLYIGLANTLVAPVSLLAPVVGGALAQQFVFHATFLVSVLAGLLTAGVLQFALYDPRFAEKLKIKPQVMTTAEG
jgi:MFS family permease